MTERAELEALADEFESVCGKTMAATLRRLAAQDQKPVAWRILCTDKSRGSTGYYYTELLPFEPGDNLRQRDEPVPLYLSPPPVEALSKPAPVAANASAEQWATDLPDGSVSFDAYAGWSRDQLKNRCLELIGRIEQLEEVVNTSAEARLREALEAVRFNLIHFANYKTDSVLIEGIDKALSTHPHANDCDKQGER